MSETNINDAIPESWPKDAPILGVEPSAWSHDVAGFVALIQHHPSLWLSDMELKYLNVYIDTRDGGFNITNRDGQIVSPDTVLAAIRKSRERFGLQSTRPLTVNTTPAHQRETTQEPEVLARGVEIVQGWLLTQRRNVTRALAGTQFGSSAMHLRLAEKHDADVAAMDAVLAAISERATLAAQLAEARAYADKLAQGLPMLPKDVELVNQANARMATELLEIENVVRSFCPIENSEDCIDDEPRAAFICCNEDADRIIEADTLAEAIAGAHGCWETMAEEAATLRTQLAEARARAKYWEDGAKFLGESLDVLQQYCQAHRIGLGGGNLAVIVTEHCDALQTQLAAAERVVERVRGQLGALRDAQRYDSGGAFIHDEDGA